MSSLGAIRLLVEEVRSLGFAAIGGAYMGIGGEFENPVRVLFVQNLTDTTLMFSLDGINDNFPLPSNGFLLLDVTSNKSTTSGLYLAEGTRVYVKQSGIPTTGDVYVTVFYGKSS